MNAISVGVWTYGMCTDRYVGGGYKPPMNLRERIAQIGQIGGVSGIEITYPGDINETNYQDYQPLLEQYQLKISCIGVELVCDKEWATGSISSPLAEVREKSAVRIMAAMDFAASIHVPVVSLWLGQDGFDYFFQADYALAWKHMVTLLQRCADHNPAIKLAIEYKVSEPRLNCFASSGGKTLALCQCADRANLGVTLDIGHAINAGENPAEIAAILMGENRLFHLHLNDNYRIVDDDMPIGSVHYLHFLEFFFWMKRMGYDGWYSLDMYPYRDDPNLAVEASVKFIAGMDAFVEEKLQNYTLSDGKKIPSSILMELFGKLFDRESK